MDKMWGERPSIAADYADLYRTDFWRNTATVMSTERTGPDLTSIGTRQPSIYWHLLHLYPKDSSKTIDHAGLSLDVSSKERSFER